MRQRPLVSIGLPVYRGERFLEQALDSLLAQTFGDYEIVISDNASDDRTQDICRGYAAEDKRIKYIRQATNLGAARNYNITFEHARGRYFKWMAHDDLIAPSFLERCVEQLEANPQAVLAFARMRFIDEQRRTIRDYDKPIAWDGASPRSRLHSLIGEPHTRSYAHKCHPITGLIRSDLLLKTRLIGGFNSSDVITLVELALLADFIEVPEYLFLRRLHPTTHLAANATPREVAKWFDPIRRHWIVAPRTRLFIECVRGVARSKAPVADRVRCLPVLADALKRDWRILGGETRRALVDTAKSLAQPAQPR